MLSVKHKVLALITRAEQTQVLAFTHRDYPNAGVQIPAGTVSEGEALEAALWREVEEESGLRREQLHLVGLVSTHIHPDWGEAGITEHLFHLRAAEALPEAWTHTVHGEGDDTGYVFEYCWLNMEMSLEHWTTRVPPWLKGSV